MPDETTRNAASTSLPMPPWAEHHGETYEEWGGEVRCRRHYTKLGHRSGPVDVCPICLSDEREHEKATRDD